MTATRVSWRGAEITNSFDIDCLPWGMERLIREGGHPAWSRIPRRHRGTKVELVTSSRWPEAECHSSYTTRPGTAPLWGKASACHRPEGLYRLPNNSSFRTACPVGPRPASLQTF